MGALAKIQKLKAGLQKKLAKHKGEISFGKRAASASIEAAEVGGAAFAASAVRGRYGAVTVLKVPLDLGLAGLFHGLGLVCDWQHESLGKHAHAMGTGFLTSSICAAGRRFGASLRKDAGEAPLMEGQGTELLLGEETGGSALEEDLVTRALKGE